ncbi:hypothetical protein F3Y22_tig00110356pilonHSYRG00055 [Hibiscus syriacus]|uniref:Uncharacterized protein n=1 Tax=Hibiscus syriacus TaxID=106335 RepID=A0A6A3AXB5_HIBSY|nr:hypothetical protein F3Y22_tig00110356pilonHSYRG00055 [Hibiscus syriacus]
MSKDEPQIPVAIETKSEVTDSGKDVAQPCVAVVSWMHAFEAFLYFTVCLMLPLFMDYSLMMATIGFAFLSHFV